MKNVSILIPAYNPGNELIRLVEQLIATQRFEIIIINDGSTKNCNSIFSQLKKQYATIVVLEHAINLGKGAALKTGLEYAYTHFDKQIGVVTADADGQHLLEDIMRVSQALEQHPTSLIIGSREFEIRGKKVPLRSRIGNLLTITLFRWIVGRKISDTQSGLRGIPRHFIPTLLPIRQNAYEFELNMLMACKHTNRQIYEVPIKTIYIDHNKSSHFKPILDSLKIYSVLFRFVLLLLSTTFVDILIFSLFSITGFHLLTCQVLSKTLSVFLNYVGVKNNFFYNETNPFPMQRFLLFAIVMSSLSYGMIDFAVLQGAFSPIAAKVAVEAILFIVSFVIQRDYILTKTPKQG